MKHVVEAAAAHETAVVWRASDSDWSGPGACYAVERADAVAYADDEAEHTNGLSAGQTVWRAEVSGVVVDWDDVADHVDHQGRQPWEVVEDDQQVWADAGVDWVRYEEDAPAGCVTWQRVSDRAQVRVERVAEVRREWTRDWDDEPQTTDRATAQDWVDEWEDVQTRVTDGEESTEWTEWEGE